MKQSIETPQWFSRTEAADYIGVSTRTIDRFISDGALKAYRFGPRVIRIRREDLDSLMQPVGGAA